MSDMHGLLRYSTPPLFCRHILDADEAHYRGQGTRRRHGSDSFDPDAVRAGDMIFVKTDRLRDFARLLPRIGARFTLVTGVSDKVPSRYRFLLDDPRIVAWAGTNLPAWSPNVLQLPIGFAEADRPFGDESAVFAAAGGLPWDERPIDILVTPMSGTSPERAAMSIAGSTVSRERLPYRDYLALLGRAKFVACPRGNGPDTLRAWEALAAGAVPIARSTLLAPLYRACGVLVVAQWADAASAAARTRDGEARRAATLDQFARRSGPLFAAHWRDAIEALDAERMRNLGALPPRWMMNAATAARRLRARARRAAGAPPTIES